MADRRVNFNNAFATTLAAPVGGSDTTATLTSVTGLSHPCYLVLDPDDPAKREYVYVSGLAGNVATLGERHLAGSAAGSGLSHDTDAVVKQSPVAQEMDDIHDRLEAATWDHGTQLTGLGDDDHTQYHNDARALTWLGTRSTSDLPEGTNLYYTDVRADARIAEHVALADPHAQYLLEADAATTYLGIAATAAAATKLATARTISLTGDVTGGGLFDGTGNLPITTIVQDNSHQHTSFSGDLVVSGGDVSGGGTLNLRRASGNGDYLAIQDNIFRFYINSGQLGYLDSAGNWVVNGATYAPGGHYAGNGNYHGGNFGTDSYLSIQDGSQYARVYLNGAFKWQVDGTGDLYQSGAYHFFNWNTGNYILHDPGAVPGFVFSTNNAWRMQLKVGGSGTSDLYINNMPDGSVSTYMKYNASNDLVSYTSSSLSKKMNVRSLDAAYAIEKMKAIEPIIYDRIQDGVQHIEGSGMDEAGYAAEWVDSVLPDLVGKNANGDPVAVNHPDFVPYLHVWIKNLDERLAALEAA